MLATQALSNRDLAIGFNSCLDEMGDPYTRIGADISGRVAIDWGVYGVPETFVIDRNGRIVYKKIGAVTPELLRDTIMPLITKLQK